MLYGMRLTLGERKKNVCNISMESHSKWQIKRSIYPLVYQWGEIASFQ